MMDRRAFLAGTLASLAAPRAVETPPIAVFSEVLDDLKLSFEEAAEVVAEAGLDGVDCPVRPGAKVLPERVEEDLPRVAEEQKKRGRKVLLLATAIRDVDSPHAEKILSTAAKLGVRYYRLGDFRYKADPKKELGEIRARLQELAALNERHGLCAIFQNHSGPGQVGAKLDDLAELLRGLDPERVALAWDVAHAIREIGGAWRAGYEKLRPHAKVLYVKDVNRAGQWVRFGEGEVEKTGFFARVKGEFQAPVSMHHEIKVPPPTRASLPASLRADLSTLKRWLA